MDWISACMGGLMVELLTRAAGPLWVLFWSSHMKTFLTDYMNKAGQINIFLFFQEKKNPPKTPKPTYIKTSHVARFENLFKTEIESFIHHIIHF